MKQFLVNTFKHGDSIRIDTHMFGTFYGTVHAIKEDAVEVMFDKCIKKVQLETHDSGRKDFTFEESESYLWLNRIFLPDIVGDLKDHILEMSIPCHDELFGSFPLIKSNIDRTAFYGHFPCSYWLKDKKPDENLIFATITCTGFEFYDDVSMSRGLRPTFWLYEENVSEKRKEKQCISQGLIFDPINENKMSYKTKRTLDAEEAATNILNFVNDISCDCETFAKIIASDHKTLQQSTMRLFIATIEELSKAGTDERNEATVALAKQITELAKDNPLPFI